MERHLKTHLYDISTAIDEVQSFFDHRVIHDYAAVTDDVILTGIAH